ncbi:MAG: hypothetical protein D6796_01895 [Caldilineae bacterium]|nr:MAG: hypothetical protein D6796_01895 [Caldilineae bacterium]
MSTGCGVWCVGYRRCLMRNTFLLPLFPLNVVLYPGMLLPLHIFEPRYRIMLQKCLAEEGKFGVVLIEHGKPEDDIAHPCKIGTIGKIMQVQKLERGEMYVWVLGTERFEIESYYLTADEYLMGRIRLLTDTPLDPLLSSVRLQTLVQSFQTYLDLLTTLNDKDRATVHMELANDPAHFSFQIAATLDIALAEKQKLLELDNVQERLATEQAILERETDYLRRLLASMRMRIQHLPWGGEVNLN